jgi:hypothetical protein
MTEIPPKAPVVYGYVEERKNTPSNALACLKETEIPLKIVILPANLAWRTGTMTGVFSFRQCAILAHEIFLGDCFIVPRFQERIRSCRVLSLCVFPIKLLHRSMLADKNKSPAATFVG